MHIQIETAFCKPYLVISKKFSHWNFWHYLSLFIILIVLNQIITGIWLQLAYIPKSDHTILSIHHIMREIKHGWGIRFLYSLGTSALFAIAYIYLYIGLLGNFYHKKLKMLWLISLSIYMLLLAESFSGYTFHWRHFLESFPAEIREWLDSLPVMILPVLLLCLIKTYVLIVKYHNTIKHNLQKSTTNRYMIFHPYAIAKDIVSTLIFLIIFASILFFTPSIKYMFIQNHLMGYLSSIHLSSLSIWYMTPFFSIFRAVDNTTIGLLLMATAIAFFFLLPWLDRTHSYFKIEKNRGAQIGIIIFIISFMGLSYLGVQPMTNNYAILGKLFSIGYFSFFIRITCSTLFKKTKLCQTCFYRSF